MRKIQVRNIHGWVAEIVRRVHSGELVIPSFQRDYCWEKQNVIDLVESLLDGTPIGSITVLDQSRLDLNLTYKDVMVDSQEARKRRFKHLDWVPKPAIILDGAQRTQTLWKLFVTGEWRLYYNIREDKYEVYHADEDRSHLDLHANVSLLSSSFLVSEIEHDLLLEKDRQYRELLFAEKGVGIARLLSRSTKNMIWDNFFVAPDLTLSILKDIRDYNEALNVIRKTRDLLTAPATSKKRKQELLGVIDRNRETVERVDPEVLQSQHPKEYADALLLQKNLEKIQIIEEMIATFEIGMLVIESRNATVADIVKAFKRMNTTGVPVDIDFLNAINPVVPAL